MVPWCRVSERAPDAIVVLNFVLRFLFLITPAGRGVTFADNIHMRWVRAGRQDSCSASEKDAS